MRKNLENDRPEGFLRQIQRRLIRRWGLLLLALLSLSSLVFI